MSGPMHAAIQRLHDQARERERHYLEGSRHAGTPGRRDAQRQQASYYARIAAALFKALRETEHAA